MSDIDTGGGKHEKGKPKKMSTRVDFTPMCDLGFLLITFFMLTTSMTKPQTMEIAMPSKKKVDVAEQTTIKASKAVTIILGKNNKVFYYEGTRENDVDPKVTTTDYNKESGVRKYLIQRNYANVIKVIDLKKDLREKKLTEDAFNKKKDLILGDKDSPIVLIKATDESSYANLIDILDEMAIANIGRYAIIDVTPFDTDLIKNLNL
jgi:biopolymer transport protein ExbD